MSHYSLPTKTSKWNSVSSQYMSSQHLKFSQLTLSSYIHAATGSFLWFSVVEMLNTHCGLKFKADKSTVKPPGEMTSSQQWLKRCQHETLTQCWFYVGPASQTVAQHKANIGSIFCVFWWLQPLSTDVCAQAHHSDMYKSGHSHISDLLTNTEYSCSLELHIYLKMWTKVHLLDT